MTADPLPDPDHSMSLDGTDDPADTEPWTGRMATEQELDPVDDIPDAPADPGPVAEPSDESE